MNSNKRVKISILIPCHNEEAGIKKCVQSCLDQTRKPDEIVVVDDASTDRSVQILKSFGKKIKLVLLEKNTGNKSYAQEHGLKFVEGDIFVATDGDTILDKNFIKHIENDFSDPKVAAVGGYVKSMKYNWLTALREMDYVIGQNLHKLAQSFIDFVFVIPGCAGAFRTDIFKNHIVFEHNTLTEDLDFTYKLHRRNLKILYDREAVVYTQDPSTLKSYINQMRRWYGGGWQNLKKHYMIVKFPLRSLEISLMYVEGIFASVLLFFIPLINIQFFAYYFPPYFLFIMVFAAYAAKKSKRPDLLIYAPVYFVIIFINAWIFLEQFAKEIILNKNNLYWYQPERVSFGD